MTRAGTLMSFEVLAVLRDYSLQIYLQHCYCSNTGVLPYGLRLCDTARVIHCLAALRLLLPGTWSVVTGLRANYLVLVLLYLVRSLAAYRVDEQNGM